MADRAVALMTPARQMPVELYDDGGEQWHRSLEGGLMEPHRG